MIESPHRRDGRDGQDGPVPARSQLRHARGTPHAAGGSTQHFVLIRQASPDRHGRQKTAPEAALLLLKAGVWPLLEYTRSRCDIAAGAMLAIYIAGTSEVVATARVEEVVPWAPGMRSSYPLLLDGIPVSGLRQLEAAGAPLDDIAQQVQTQLHQVDAHRLGSGGTTGEQEDDAGVDERHAAGDKFRGC